MMLNVVDNYSIKFVTLYTTVSCAYLPLLLLFITYTQIFNEIGKYSTSYIPAIIILMEFIKLKFSVMLRTNTNFNGKDNQIIKKCYTKVKMKEIFKCIFLILSTVGIYYIIAVLFGAELNAKCEETFMLSILVASLTVVPSCLIVGTEQTISFLAGKYTYSNLVDDMILQYIQFTFLGSWLGAIVIPLDWDRPWQVWPIPCYVGALAGNFLSHIFTLIKLLPNIFKAYTGKSFKFNRLPYFKTKM